MADTLAIAPLRAIVDGYFAMWNETDPARRRELIADTWSDGAGYVDPLFAAEGHEALDAMVAQVQERFPGYRFRLTRDVDSHHDRARWSWELIGPEEGPAVAAGIDVAVLAPDGRLRDVAGFFLPQAEGA